VTAGYEALSPLECLFLYLESPRTPMHTGSVGVFEGGPLRDRHGLLRLADIRREIERRLHLVPKLRRRVRFTTFGEAPPVWADDPHFDIAYHVRRAAVPAPGGEDELTGLVAEIMAVALDRERPLWELWVVEGLHGGRVGLIQKIHHALADGLASVELATVLLDGERHPPGVRRPAPVWDPRPEPPEVAVLARQVARRGAVGVHAAGRTMGAVLDPVGTARRAGELAEALGTLGGALGAASPSSLNVAVGQSRRMAVVRQPMDELRRVEHRFGVTVNDALLAAVAAGLQALFTSRHEVVDGRTLQVLVPVGMDHHGDHRLGNQVSALLVPLPIGVDDPVERLTAVSGAVARCKSHHQAQAAALLIGLLDPLPQPALATVARLVHHQPVVNLVVTNVPGPAGALYAMGARMLEAFPVVPLAGNLSVGIAAFSYANQLSVGILADRDRCADIDVLAAGMRRGFADVVAAATPRAGAPRPAPAARRRGGPTGADIVGTRGDVAS